MRLVLAGKRTDLSLKYVLQKDTWDELTQGLKGKHPDKGYLLNLTNKYRQNALQAYEQMVQKGMSADVSLIRRKLIGQSFDVGEPTLIRLFERAIDRKRQLQGKNNSKATVQKYERCRRHLVTFLCTNYDLADMRFHQIDLRFIEDFELYLKAMGNCCHNTTMKHIQTFKTVFKNAVAHGYTDKDPFQKYKVRMEEVTRFYLSEQELERLKELEQPTPKLDKVRDLFLFSCYTGLAYIDLKNLAIKNIQLENGKYWIRTRRQKTNVKTNVPLLNFPLTLMTKYCPSLADEDPDMRVFPVMSNQKINKYLKDIALLSGIRKGLSFHIARHTFATTVTLNNGVPIESVSTMLGHKHITTTQHYAKLLDKKLERDMETLNAKLA